MEKPKITEGEWMVSGNQPYSIKTRVDDVVNTGSDPWGKTGVDKLEDAKAISAVPDMIDALTYVLECHRSGARYMILDKIEEALKKAGVKFETEPQKS